MVEIQRELAPVTGIESKQNKTKFIKDVVLDHPPPNTIFKNLFSLGFLETPINSSL